MDKQDWTAEQQVWQRVRSCQEEAPGQDLRQLQREAMELAAVYLGLAGQFSGKIREQLLELHRGERANAAALTGIGVLACQPGENLKVWRPEREAARKVLERCYHRTRRCMTEYTARSAQGEFGVVFEKLAGREREHCALIAEVLGSLK